MDDFRVGSIPLDPDRSQTPSDSRNRQRKHRPERQNAKQDDIVILSEPDEAKGESAEDSYLPSSRNDEPA